MDWNVVAQYLPLFEKAAWLTLRLGLAGIALAIVIGLVCALVQYYKVPVLRRVVGFYIQLSRNTPLLVQLFFLYYGLPKIGIRTDAAVCGIAGLAFLGGSYMAEAFRSGLESIEPIQTESAYSLGMDRMQTMRYVILPQAMSTSVPAFVANVIFLLKETSVFSAISLMDLMFTAKDLIGLYYKTTESLFLLVVFYLLILLPVSLLGSLLERRLRYAGFGASPRVSGNHPHHAADGAAVSCVFRHDPRVGLGPLGRDGIRHRVCAVGHGRDERPCERRADLHPEAPV